MNLTRNEQLMQSLERLEAAKQRAQEANYSRQPRFAPKSAEGAFWGIYHWLKRADLDEPAYQVDSRTRDQWLSGFWRREGHLAGVVNSVVAIDKNRAWAITGGRNQVNRYTRILREAEDGQGWRYYMNQQAQSYYTADIGAITEIGREGVGGPLRALYSVDSTLCHLTGNAETPLRYDHTRDAWAGDDFFRVVSMPSPRESLRGLGYCAVSRVLEMAKLMIAIYEHDQESLGARSPKGLLLLKGVSEEQWRGAMAARSAELDGREQEWFGGVAVLASEGINDVEAKLFALSQLPAGFNIEVTTKLLMYAYALGFGYDPIEFWPVEAGSLGRGRETEIQHQKATGKGGADFMLSFQDRLQMALPDTLTFEFEQRDAQGMVLEAGVIQAWADVANSLYQGGAGILSREQAASLLVENGIIPAEWTVIEEDVVGTDVESARLNALRRRALEDEQVLRAIARYPQEPIVRYQWPTGKTSVLWARGEDAVGRLWQVVRPDPAPTLRRLDVQRQEEGETLYTGSDFTITEADVTRAIDDGRRRVGDEFAELLTARTLGDEELDTLEGGA